MKEFFAALLASVIAFFSPIELYFTDKVNNYEFTVDASQTGEVLPNPASNINVWSIDGNPFVGNVLNLGNSLCSETGKGRTEDYSLGGRLS